MTSRAVAGLTQDAQSWPKPVVLVVEDDPRYRKLLELNLVADGYQVLMVESGLAALNEVTRTAVLLIILDLMLPDIDGFDLCARLRRSTNVPIIMVTAKAEEANKVRGLRLGADDYVTKPFGSDELLARIKAVLRRAHSAARAATPDFSCGKLVIDFVEHRVTVDGCPVYLTRREFKLLYYLAQHPGQGFTQDDLLRRVWGAGFQQRSHVLHATVRRVRKKIEANPSTPRHLLTRPGGGYVLASST